MTIKEKPKTYETSDREEFSSKAEAKRHEDFLHAKNEYEDARKALGRRAAELCKTADGVPFSFDRWTYYAVRGFMSMPRVFQVSPTRWMDVEFTFEYGKYDATCHVPETDHHGMDTGKYTSHRISDLFAVEANANRELLKKQREFIENCTAEADELEKRIK